MSSLQQKQKFWTDYYEEKQFSNVVRHYDISNQKKSFLLESRFKVFEDSLKKAKQGSKEFDHLLNECVDIFMVLHEIDSSRKNEIISYAKNKMLEDAFIDEFDGKKVKHDFWPYKGRITLREAINKSFIGQHPDADHSTNVTHSFRGKKMHENYPSPSSSC